VDSQKTRAILKIQEGCEVMCTFCVIPLARGRSRSRSIAELTEEIKSLEAAGFNEVVITGTHLPDYRDGRVRLRELLEELLESTSKMRMRISSLEPPFVTKEILKLMKSEPRLCPHLHLSIQSTEDKILDRMNRDYGKKDIAECMDRIAAIDERIFVGMDLISCFPGETDEDHQNTVKFLQDHPWTKIHVFPYSKRKGTPAALYTDQVKTHKRGPRVKELLSLSDERLNMCSNREIGQTHELLIERSKKSTHSEGTSEYFWKVQIDDPRLQVNDLKKAKIIAVKKPGILLGQLI
jgi:threonylcarbamoyladenosine tRNA methylthiotransferase MtaB